MRNIIRAFKRLDGGQFPVNRSLSTKVLDWGHFLVIPGMLGVLCKGVFENISHKFDSNKINLKLIKETRFK